MDTNPPGVFLWVEQTTNRTRTHLQDFDMTFDLQHPSRGIETPPSDQPHGDLFQPLHVKTEFDPARTTLSQSLKQHVRAELENGAMGIGGGVGHCCGVGVDVAIRWDIIIRNLVWLVLRWPNAAGHPFSG